MTTTHPTKTIDHPTIPVPTLATSYSYRGHATSVVNLLTWAPKPGRMGKTWVQGSYNYATGVSAPGYYVPSATRKFGNWSVDVKANGTRRIFHYSTCMLVLDADGTVIDYSTGHGSVSDQQMMNKLFRALPGCTLGFSRAGGARIVDAK